MTVFELSLFYETKSFYELCKGHLLVRGLLHNVCPHPLLLRAEALPVLVRAKTVPETLPAMKLMFNTYK